MSHNTSLSLAVHLHLHYLDMWEEMRGYLENIGDQPYFLFVTITSDSPELEEQIRNFHPHCEIHRVKNNGYDVGAFIHFLHHIDLDQYDVILKLHTKNHNGDEVSRINHRCISRRRWFYILMDALLSSKECFRANLQRFAKDRRLGMLGSRYLITSRCSSREVEKGVGSTMKMLGCPEPKKITFVAGTIFMVRSCLLKHIKDTYHIRDFADVEHGQKDGTFAHVFERVFGCYVESCGYTIRGSGRNLFLDIEPLLRIITSFVYQQKITASNHLIVKVFKLPIIYLKRP